VARQRPRAADPRTGRRNHHGQRSDGGVSTGGTIFVGADPGRRWSGIPFGGGAIEMGAGCADMLRRLDMRWISGAVRAELRCNAPRRSRHPQLRFTPYPFEDVGLLCRVSDPSLYLFSSDYPHAEGGRDPLGRFAKSLGDVSDAVAAGFFAGNAHTWLGH
jgi:hypothetical protein